MSSIAHFQLFRISLTLSDFFFIIIVEDYVLLPYKADNNNIYFL
jgi:hypothetical protein